MTEEEQNGEKDERQEKVSKLYDSALELMRCNAEQVESDSYRFVNLGAMSSIVDKLDKEDAFFMLALITMALQTQDQDAFSFLCTQFGVKIENGQDKDKEFSEYIDVLLEKAKKRFTVIKKDGGLTEEERKVVEEKKNADS